MSLPWQLLYPTAPATRAPGISARPLLSGLDRQTKMDRQKLSQTARQGHAWPGGKAQARTASMPAAMPPFARSDKDQDQGGAWLGQGPGAWLPRRCGTAGSRTSDRLAMKSALLLLYSEVGTRIHCLDLPPPPLSLPPRLPFLPRPRLCRGRHRLQPGLPPPSVNSHQIASSLPQPQSYILTHCSSFGTNLALALARWPFSCALP